MNISYNTENVSKYIKPGHKIFVPIYETFEDSEKNAHQIPCCVEEDIALYVDYIVVLNQEIMKEYNLKNETAWWYLEGGGQKERIVGYIEPNKDARDYDSYGFLELPLSVLEGAQIVNQFIWLKDHCHGHSENLDDDIFLNEIDAWRSLINYANDLLEDKEIINEIKEIVRKWLIKCKINVQKSHQEKSDRF
jgi:hypothetical protein